MKQLLSVIILIFVLLIFPSCAEEKKVLQSPDSNTVCTVFCSGNGNVTKLKLETGDKTYTLRPDSTICDNGDGVEFTDLNFDGISDIRLPVSVGNQTKYKNWLIIDGKPISFALLDSFLSPLIDADSKTITAGYSKRTVEPATDDTPEVYIDEKGTETYKWNDGKLKVCRRECVTYYSESEIYCLAVWELDSDGILEAVSEHWLTPEQYDNAGKVN